MNFESALKAMRKGEYMKGYNSNYHQYWHYNSELKQYEGVDDANILYILTDVKNAPKYLKQFSWEAKQ